MFSYGVLWCMGVEATIKVTPEVKGRLDKLKNYPRETYSDVIDRLTRDALEEAAGELTDEDIRDIEEAIADIKAGRVYTTEELKRELGID
jgi:predicted transcriptional regulator